jgi:hypothetical protein
MGPCPEKKQFWFIIVNPMHRKPNRSDMVFHETSVIAAQIMRMTAVFKGRSGL